MLTHSPQVSIRIVVATLLAALVTFLAVTPLNQPADAAIGGIPSPCNLPGGDLICDVIGKTAKEAAQAVASATANFIMRGVTVWVTDAAVWVTGKVGSLIDSTTSPNVQAEWFQGQYRSMLTVAGALALPLLLLAVIQAIWRQDVWILMRSAFGFLPMAFILAGVAIVATQLLISITDDLSTIVVSGLGDSSNNLLGSVGDAYKRALDDTSGGAIPLFGIFLGAIILALGAFVLWLEMVIRDAAIYIALFFIPLTFVAMIWPATSRWARRLVELLVAVIVAKFVIVSILSLASAAITNTTLTDSGQGSVFERMIAGAALLVLAAWSPFALLRILPMMEVAAASVTSQRQSMSNAAGSAGIQSPAGYMRQAMDRHSRASSSPAYATTGGATYAGSRAGNSSSFEGHPPMGEARGERTAETRPGTTSFSGGGAVYRGTAPRGSSEVSNEASGGSRSPHESPVAGGVDTQSAPPPPSHQGPRIPPSDSSFAEPRPQPSRPVHPPEPPRPKLPPRDED